MEKKMLVRIEALRRKLNKYGSRRNFVDQEVVRLSQELDCLLNQYQRSVAYRQLSFW